MGHVIWTRVPRGFFCLVGFSLLAALGGCVAQNTVVSGYMEGPSKINFTVVDARPGEEKTSERPSVWAKACEFGVVRMGDDVSAPTRMIILQKDIENRLGSRVANTTLTVTRYRMFLNTSRWERSIDEAAAFGASGPLGEAAASGMLPDCSKKNAPGWYDATEVTTHMSPIIAEISAKYLGKELDVRTVYSPDVPMAGGGFRNSDQEPSVYGAIEKANLALISQLQSATPMATPSPGY